MRRSALALGLSALLAHTACTTPPPAPPAPSRVAVWEPPRLKGGCLLPDPRQLRAVVSPAAIGLAVTVDATGQGAAVQLEQGSGVPALDQAFTSAAMACRFQPATSDGVPTAGVYRLQHRWHPADSFAGPHRCFPVAYPRRVEQPAGQADLRLAFRLPADRGAAEIRVTSAAIPPAVSALSVEAAQQCLVHREARQNLPVGQWIAIAYRWRLEEAAR